MNKEELTAADILAIVNQNTGLQINDTEVDIIACGVDQLDFSIITIIEKKYGVELSLDKLETRNFLINANNLIFSMTKRGNHDKNRC